MEEKKESEQFSVSPGNRRTEEVIPETMSLKGNRPADELKQPRQNHVNTHKLTATRSNVTLKRFPRVPPYVQQQHTENTQGEPASVIYC